MQLLWLVFVKRAITCIVWNRILKKALGKINDKEHSIAFYNLRATYPIQRKNHSCLAESCRETIHLRPNTDEPKLWSLDVALLPPPCCCLCTLEDGLSLSHALWSPSPLCSICPRAGGAGMALAVLVRSSSSSWDFSQCFVVSSDVVLACSGPEEGWPHAETPGWLSHG